MEDWWSLNYEKFHDFQCLEYFFSGAVIKMNLLVDAYSVVTVMTGLLITSERSHYFRKSYLEERGLTSTKSYADRLTEIRLKIP